MPTTRARRGIAKSTTETVRPSARRRYDAFIDQYFATNMNGTQAAINAGYSSKTAASIASELLIHPYVAVRVKARADELAAKNRLSAEDALHRLKGLNTLSLKQIFDPRGTPIPPHELDDFVATLIDGVEMTEDSYLVGKTKHVLRTYKYKITRKGGALDMLMKHHGLYAKDNEQRAADPEQVAAAVRARLAQLEAATSPKGDK